MDIILIRHAHALSVEDAGVNGDEDRPLSEKGIQQAKALAHALRDHAITCDVVATTPLARAKRMAEILLEEWSPPVPELLVSKMIAPECKPRKLGRFLRGLGKEKVAVVGHQPDLSLWASWLIGSKKIHVDFPKAGAAHITWEDKLKKGSGSLIWLVTPTWYATKTEVTEETETPKPQESQEQPVEI